MPRSEYDEDEAYDSVDEDAELELSCALHDLAERVKMFEENMKGRLRVSGIDCESDDGEEIGEDIPEVDDDHEGAYGYASPKKKDAKKHGRRRRQYGAKHTQSKQQDDDEDDALSEDVEDEDDDDEDDDDGDAKRETGVKQAQRNEWDEQNEREELSEMKYNISKLLQGFKEQAKALEAGNQ